MKLVLGSQGRLGHALTASFRNDEVIAPKRELYAGWSCVGMGDSVAKYLDAQRVDTVYVASGLINPRLPPADLEAVNVVLPRNVIAGAGKSGCRVITFGTVMEELVGAAAGNAYIRSKVQLAEEATQAARAGTAVLHLRLHTLYGGGPPDPFMFLGQLLQAAQNDERFKMSSGDQLREYHHIEDEVSAIRMIVQSEHAGITDLSHGEPVRLRDIATYVFERLERTDLLDIGALGTPPAENYKRSFPRQQLLAEIHFRNTLPSIFEYLATWIRN